MSTVTPEGVFDLACASIVFPILMAARTICSSESAPRRSSSGCSPRSARRLTASRGRPSPDHLTATVVVTDS